MVPQREALITAAMMTRRLPEDGTRVRSETPEKADILARQQRETGGAQCSVSLYPRFFSRGALFPK